MLLRQLFTSKEITYKLYFKLITIINLGAKSDRNTNPLNSYKKKLQKIHKHIYYKKRK